MASYTNLDTFVQECVKKVVQEFIGVVNSVSELPQNPHHGCFRLWFVQRVHILTQSRNNSFVFAWVSTEDILGNDDGFLYHVSHFGFDKIKKSLNAAVGSCFNFDGQAPNRSNCFTNEINIDFGGVPSEKQIQFRDKKRWKG